MDALVNFVIVGAALVGAALLLIVAVGWFRSRGFTSIEGISGPRPR